MNINWKVRIRNKQFWLAMAPAILLLIQAGAAVVGVELDFGDLGNRVMTFINAAFVLLSMLGVVNDPTTAGVSDSSRALTYEKPKEG